MLLDKDTNKYIDKEITASTSRTGQAPRQARKGAALALLPRHPQAVPKSSQAALMQPLYRGRSHAAPTLPERCCNTASTPTPIAATLSQRSSNSAPNPLSRYPRAAEGSPHAALTPPPRRPNASSRRRHDASCRPTPPRRRRNAALTNLISFLQQ